MIDADEYTRLVKTSQIASNPLKRKSNHDGNSNRDRQLEWTKAVLSQYGTGHVIACGPILATRGCREFTREFAKTHPVIYIRSCKEYTDANPTDPVANKGANESHGGPPKWMQELLTTCYRLSNYDFFNLPERWKDDLHHSSGETSLAEAFPFRNLSRRQMQALQRTQASLASFLASALGYEASSLSHTVFPTLYPRLPQHRIYSTMMRVRLSGGYKDISCLNVGADAVEIINDIWQCAGSDGYQVAQIARIVAEIRRYLQVPVFYHIELEPDSQPKNQQGWDAYLKALYRGLRLAPEYLTVDWRAGDRFITDICRHSGHTTIVGHYEHLEKDEGFWSSSVPFDRYTRLVRLGCGITRIIKQGQSAEEDYHCLAFIAKIASDTGVAPLVAYNMGRTGRLSQICNPILSPVSIDDEDNGSWDVPIKIKWSTLFTLNMVDPLRFYVFGGSASHSMSPAMHNVGFKALGMRHSYETRESEVLDDLPSMWRDPNFGGASITQPFKKDILRYVHHQSPSVEMIGAANTILPIRRQGQEGYPAPCDYRSKKFRHKAGPVLGLFADNTDWMGVCACLSRSISPANTINRETVGLVIGAGGMARAAVYSLLYLGVRNIFIYNRTLSRAKTLATHFQQAFAEFVTRKSPDTARGLGDHTSTTGFHITTLSSVDDPWPDDFNPPSIVIGAIKAPDPKSQISTPFVMPPSWISSPTGGVVVEVSTGLPLSFSTNMRWKLLTVPPSKLSFFTPETHLMRQFREQKPPGWTLVDPIEVLHSQACTQFEIFTGCRAPAGVMRDACLHDYIEKMKRGVFDREEL